MTMLQRNFLLIGVVLLLMSAALIAFDMVLLATVPLFVLALVLIAGRFVF